MSKTGYFSPSELLHLQDIRGKSTACHIDFTVVYRSQVQIKQNINVQRTVKMSTLKAKDWCSEASDCSNAFSF